jgi:hypothetical protein
MLGGGVLSSLDGSSPAKSGGRIFYRAKTLCRVERSDETFYLRFLIKFLNAQGNLLSQLLAHRVRSFRFFEKPVNLDDDFVAQTILHLVGRKKACDAFLVDTQLFYADNSPNNLFIKFFQIFFGLIRRQAPNFDNWHNVLLGKW